MDGTNDTQEIKYESKEDELHTRNDRLHSFFLFTIKKNYNYYLIKNKYYLKCSHILHTCAHRRSRNDSNESNYIFFYLRNISMFIIH